MAYKVGLADTKGKNRIKRQVVKLLNQVDPVPRIDIVYNLFMSDLIRDKIGKPGSKALRFKDLKIGDMFIGMPMPGDDHGHGGFKRGTNNIFMKIQGIPDKLYYYGERGNTRCLTTGNISTMPSCMHVIKVNLRTGELMPVA